MWILETKRYGRGPGGYEMACSFAKLQEERGWRVLFVTTGTHHIVAVFF